MIWNLKREKKSCPKGRFEPVSITSKEYDTHFTICVTKTDSCNLVSWTFVPLCTFYRDCFTHLTAGFTSDSKRNVHWVSLKHRFNTWTLARFYYAHIGTYCCVLLECIVAVQDSNIQGPLLKINVLSCWKYSLHKPNPKPTWYIYIYAFSRCFYPKRLTVHSGYTCFVSMCVPWRNSVDKCKTDIKTYLLIDATVLLELHICRFELFCRTVITLDSNQSSHVKYVSVLRELPNKPTVSENIDMKLDMCDANIQKHQFSNLQHINIVLKS